jgi:hypothetical protein
MQSSALPGSDSSVCLARGTAGHFIAGMKDVFCPTPFVQHSVISTLCAGDPPSQHAAPEGGLRRQFDQLIISIIDLYQAVE